MAQLDFHIGSSVECMDGKCGKLAKVVVNPESGKITDLVIEKGFLLKEDLVIPVTVVQSADADTVKLTIDSRQLSEHPVYNEQHFSVPAPETPSPPELNPADFLYWAAPFGGAYRRMPHGDMLSIDPYEEKGFPRVRVEIQEGHSLPPEYDVLEKGTKVKSDDGEIGHVDHLLADASSDKVTHIVIDRGAQRDSLVIPISRIREIHKDGIQVSGSTEELEQLNNGQ